jgi:hypothetical protein
MRANNLEENSEEQDPECGESAEFCYEVWSISPTGKRPRCWRIFDYEDWQFAEKLGELLRSKGHEEVEVRLSQQEE